MSNEHLEWNLQLIRPPAIGPIAADASWRFRVMIKMRATCLVSLALVCTAIVSPQASCQWLRPIETPWESRFDAETIRELLSSLELETDQEAQVERIVGEHADEVALAKQGSSPFASRWEKEYVRGSPPTGPS